MELQASADSRSQISRRVELLVGKKSLDAITFPFRAGFAGIAVLLLLCLAALLARAPATDCFCGSAHHCHSRLDIDAAGTGHRSASETDGAGGSASASQRLRLPKPLCRQFLSASCSRRTAGSGNAACTRPAAVRFRPERCGGRSSYRKSGSVRHIRHYVGRTTLSAPHRHFHRRRSDRSRIIRN